MALSVQELRSLVVAARLGSIGRAAKALNITQPALSRRIAAAEEAVGIKLLERKSRGVVATPAGAAFMRYAEIALINIDDARAAALNAHGSEKFDVSIAIVDALYDEQLVAAFVEAAAEIDRVNIMFSSPITSADVSDEVLGGRARLGLRFGLDQNPQLDALFIRDEAAVVACGPSHPLAKGGRASIADLERAQWLGFPLATIPATGSYNAYLAMRGLDDQKTMPLHSLHARIRVLEGGFGLTRIRRASIARELEQGRLIELETPIPTNHPLFLIWRRDAFLDAPAEQLRQKIGEILKQA